MSDDELLAFFLARSASVQHWHNCQQDVKIVGPVGSMSEQIPVFYTQNLTISVNFYLMINRVSLVK